LAESSRAKRQERILARFDSRDHDFLSNLNWTKMSITSPPPKRKRGRPPRGDPAICYTLRFTRQQAAYLTFLAKVAGWAPTANAAAKLIVDSELRRLSASGFHERYAAFPSEMDQSGERA
jgi:hypothetical protein